MSLTGSSSQTRPARLLTQQEKLARVHEEEVYPLFGQKLADLLMANLVLAPGGQVPQQVLQIGCGLGTTNTEILQRTDADSRLIAMESTPVLVERARANVPAEYLGPRVFFREHNLEGTLPFAEDVFDHVLANISLADLASPSVLISELVRVTKPGGELRLATPLAGTWREFLDVYSDVLVRLRKPESAEALAAYGKSFPEPETLAKQLEAAGLGQVAVETTHWELIFRTGREFFYAPVIEHGPLPRWKSIAGKGAEMQDIFLAVKEAIDTYFAGSAFGVGVVAGVFSGTKLS
jgi:ubiquinone/menaquinone biosynthesis C-methylase UbiE